MAGDITAPGIINASNTKLEFNLPLGTAGAYVWCQLSGAGAVSVNNGERPIQERATFDGTVTQTGEKTKPEITVDIPSALIHTRVFKSIVNLFENDQLLEVRWSFPGRTIMQQTTASNDDVSISTSGVVSFGSAVSPEQLAIIGSSRIPEGASLFTGSAGNYRDFLLEEKTFNAQGALQSLIVVDAATDAFPSSAVTNENFGFRNPSMEQPAILCDIMQAGNTSAEAEQAGLSSELQLKAVSDLLPARVVSN